MPSICRVGARRSPAAALVSTLAGGLLLWSCSGEAQRPTAPSVPTMTTAAVQSTSQPATTHERGAYLGVFEVRCHTGRGITASGRPTSREIVAVDRRVIPFGARVLVEKVGARVAGDTGPAVRGRRLDIWEPSVAACTRFGRQRLRVWRQP